MSPYISTLVVLLHVAEVVAADEDGGAPVVLVRRHRQVEGGAGVGGDAGAGVLQVGGPGLAERAVLAVGVLDGGWRLLAGVQVGVAARHLQVDVDVAAEPVAGHQVRSGVALDGVSDLTP